MNKRNELGGRIINVSSLAGLISLPLIGAYAASKHALEAAFDALRIELWNTNIKVITINPGVISTSIYYTLKNKTEDILTDENENKTRFARAYDRYLLKSSYYTGLNPIVVAKLFIRLLLYTSFITGILWALQKRNSQLGCCPLYLISYFIVCSLIEYISDHDMYNAV